MATSEINPLRSSGTICITTKLCKSWLLFWSAPPPSVRTSIFCHSGIVLEHLSLELKIRNGGCWQEMMFSPLNPSTISLFMEGPDARLLNTSGEEHALVRSSYSISWCVRIRFFPWRTLPYEDVINFQLLPMFFVTWRLKLSITFSSAVILLGGFGNTLLGFFGCLIPPGW